MNTVPALLSLPYLRHLPCLRPHLLPGTLIPPFVYMKNLDVKKCTYFRAATCSSSLIRARRNALNVAQCGSAEVGLLQEGCIATDVKMFKCGGMWGFRPKRPPYTAPAVLSFSRTVRNRSGRVPDFQQVSGYA